MEEQASTKSLKLKKPDLYVVARFLDTLHNHGEPMKKTNLQMRVGLNYIRFMEYLNWLTYNGLVQKVIDNESELYRLSPKGLEVYHKLIELIKDILKATKF